MAAVVLFDGVCNLCNGVVRFILAHDKAAKFRFAALQSEAGKRMLAANCRAGCKPADRLSIGPGERSSPGLSGPAPSPSALESIVLLDQGQIYNRSTAALRIARVLPFPWPLLYALIAVPRPLRDWVYDWVARHRYGWFGKQDACMVPTPEMKSRFLD